MGIFVVAECNKCGRSERVHPVITAGEQLGPRSILKVDSNSDALYLLPVGWVTGRPSGVCFCSKACALQYEAKVVRNEIEEKQAKLEGILVQIGVAIATEEE